MKLTPERIEEIEAAWKKWKARNPDQSSIMTRAKFAAILETAIPELLSEREEREKKQVFCEHCHTLAMCHLVGSERICGDCVHLCLDRAESAEKALRDWALTARRLWGGGGGVHWKSFYAILDAGKGEE